MHKPGLCLSGPRTQPRPSCPLSGPSQHWFCASVQAAAGLARLEKGIISVSCIVLSLIPKMGNRPGRASQPPLQQREERGSLHSWEEGGAQVSGTAPKTGGHTRVQAHTCPTASPLAVRPAEGGWPLQEKGVTPGWGWLVKLERLVTCGDTPLSKVPERVRRNSAPAEACAADHLAAFSGRPGGCSSPPSQLALTA